MMWLSVSLDLGPAQHLWNTLKMAVHWRFPSSKVGLERFFQEEWNLLSLRAADLVLNQVEE